MTHTRTNGLEEQSGRTATTVLTERLRWWRKLTLGRPLRGLDPRAVTRALPHWYLDVKGGTSVTEYLGSWCIAGPISERRLSLRAFVWEERVRWSSARLVEYS